MNKRIHFWFFVLAWSRNLCPEISNKSIAFHLLYLRFLHPRTATSFLIYYVAQALIRRNHQNVYLFTPLKTCSTVSNDWISTGDTLQHSRAYEKCDASLLVPVAFAPLSSFYFNSKCVSGLWPSGIFIKTPFL